jgi:hypothetical protein
MQRIVSGNIDNFMQGSALCADEVTDILLRQVPVDK